MFAYVSARDMLCLYASFEFKRFLLSVSRRDDAKQEHNMCVWYIYIARAQIQAHKQIRIDKRKWFLLRKSQMTIIPKSDYKSFLQNN